MLLHWKLIPPQQAVPKHVKLAVQAFPFAHNNNNLLNWFETEGHEVTYIGKRARTNLEPHMHRNHAFQDIRTGTAAQA